MWQSKPVGTFPLLLPCNWNVSLGFSHTPVRDSVWSRDDERRSVLKTVETRRHRRKKRSRLQETGTRDSGFTIPAIAGLTPVEVQWRVARRGLDQSAP